MVPTTAREIIRFIQVINAEAFWREGERIARLKGQFDNANACRELADAVQKGYLMSIHDGTVEYRWMLAGMTGAS